MNTRKMPAPVHGFSLIELLVAVAVISSLAAMVLFHLTNIHGNSRTAATRMNATSICSMYQSARAVGVTFQSATAEGIVQELSQGKRGAGQFASSHFQLAMSEDERKAALAICTFDPLADALLIAGVSR